MRNRNILALTVATGLLAAGCTGPEVQQEHVPSVNEVHAQKLGQTFMDNLNPAMLMPQTTVLIAPESHVYKDMKRGEWVNVSDDTEKKTMIYIETDYPNKKFKGEVDTYDGVIYINDTSKNVIRNMKINKQAKITSKISAIAIESQTCRTIEQCSSEYAGAGDKAVWYRQDEGNSEWITESVYPQRPDEKTVLAALLPLYNHG